MFSFLCLVSYLWFYILQCILQFDVFGLLKLAAPMMLTVLGIIVCFGTHLVCIIMSPR